MWSFLYLFLIFTSSNGEKFFENEDCDFQNNLCGWKDDVTKWKFQRKTGLQILENGLIGPKNDHLDDQEAFFLHLNLAETFNETTDYSYFVSFKMDGKFEDNPVKRCFQFYYNIQQSESEDLLEDLYISIENMEGIPQDLWRYRKNTNNEWKMGQVYIDVDYDFMIRIVALRTKPGDGYIAFDDYSIKTDVSREACEILPPDAAIGEPSTTASTQSPNSDTVNCDFSKDFCNWSQGDGLKWRVGNTNVFHYEGVQCPEKGTDGTVTDSFVLLAQKGEDNHGIISILQTTENSKDGKTCIMFDFSLYKEGGFESVRVKTKDPSTGQLMTVWEILDTSVFADEVWWMGQAEVYKNQVVIEAVHNNDPVGFVALDNFIQEDKSDCPTEPATAAVSTIDPGTTTETPKPDTTSQKESTFPGCDFESSICDYRTNMDNADTEYWKRGTTNGFEADGVECPTGDMHQNKDAYYMLASSTKDGNFGILDSPSVETDETSCMIFRFNIPYEAAFTAMKVYTIDKNGDDLLVWDLEDTSIFADSSWFEAQVEVYNRHIQFEVEKGNPSKQGYVAIDNIQAIQADVCHTIPKEAEIVTVTPEIPTSTTPNNAGFTECTFDFGECGYQSNKDEDNLNFWEIGSTDEHARDGIECPPNDFAGLKSGKYALAVAKRKGPVAILTSPHSDNEGETCITFYYNIPKAAELAALRVMTYLPGGEEITVWELSGVEHFQSDTTKWEQGRVKVNNRQIKFEAVIEGHTGWVAVDTIEKDMQSSECTVLPEAASVSTPSPETTPSPGGPVPNCDFTSDLCGWITNKDEMENLFWTRGNTNAFVESNTECPDSGHTQENKEDNYMLANYDTKGDYAILRTDKFESDKKICLNFYFSITQNGMFTQLQVFTATTPGEGPLQVVWDLSDKSQLADGVWFYGQVEVHERQVMFQATKGDDLGGWVAIDDIAVIESAECTVFPESAMIPTEAPTDGPSTTVNPAVDPFSCDFEETTCGWQTGDWFQRSTSRETDGKGPTGDFENNEDGHFLISYNKNKEGVAVLESPYVEQQQTICMQFWFSIFREGDYQNLMVLTEDNNGNSILIFDLSDRSIFADDEWYFGQVEVNTKKVIFKSNVLVEANKGFVALDEFAVVENVDCVTRPDQAAVSTLPPQTTTQPSEADLSCTFEVDECNWFIDHDLNNTYLFEFIRMTPADIQNGNGPESDHDVNKQAYFLYADATLGEPQTVTGIVSRDQVVGTELCVEFWYQIPHREGIEDLQVASLPTDFNKERITHWQYSTRVDFWEKGRIEVSRDDSDYKILFEAVRGTVSRGYVALDDFLVLTHYESCHTLPVDAATSTPDSGSTTQPSGIQPNCNFDEGMCDWRIDELTWKWTRVNLDELHTEGKQGPARADGHFLYLGGSDAEGDTNAEAAFRSPMETRLDHCFTFDYSIFHQGGISSFRVLSLTDFGEFEVVWALEGYSHDSNEYWDLGQARITGNEVVFEVVAGTVSEGYVAVDEVHFDNNEECKTVPDFASPMTTSNKPETTSHAQTGGFDCDFSDSQCDWNNVEDGWKWARTSIDELENQQVPHPVEADGSFMYVHGNPESKAGIIAMAEATQEFKCMTFDYALEKNLGITGLVVQSLRPESTDIVWSLDVSAPDTDGLWELAQVFVGDSTEIAILVYGGVENNGYAGIDNIKLRNSEECTLIPEYAKPGGSTTNNPDTTPSSDFQDCTFENDLCGWISPTEPSWSRVNVKQLEEENKPVPGGKDDGYFMYADGTTGEPGQTILLETQFLGSAVSTCMLFYFNIFHDGGFKSMSIKTLSHDGDEELLWQLSDYSHASNDKWDMAQIFISAPKIVIEAVKGDKKNGYVALDDLLFDNQVNSDVCTPYPPEAEPGHTTPDVHTTPTPSKGLSDCNFAQDTCDWSVESIDDKFRFSITGTETAEGPHDMHQDANDEHFALASAFNSPENHETSLISKFFTNTNVEYTCMHFWFNIMSKDSTIYEAGVFLSNFEGIRHPVWYYQAGRQTEQQEQWTVGIVPIPPVENYQLLFTVLSGSHNEGYIAVDDFMFFDGEPDCYVQPAWADPSGEPSTTPQPGSSTTPSPEQGISCLFDKDFCNLEVTGMDNTFKFAIERGTNFDNMNDGPTLDHNQDPQAGFAYVNAELSDKPGIVTEMAIPMLNGKEHEIQCLHFWYSIKHDGGIGKIAVVQQDESKEDGPEIIEILWEISSSMHEEDMWNEGQMEVRAHLFEDVVQNYTVRWVAQSGSSRVGWAAIDDFTMIRSEDCEYMPREALPSSTQAPPTNTPPNENFACDFEQNDCGFASDFKRKQAKEVEDIYVDHNENPEGYIMVANIDGVNQAGAFMKSPEFKGTEHFIECFNFWFFIDSFHQNDNQEVFGVAVVHENETNTVEWTYQSNTEGSWIEGQVELRAWSHEDGSYENWKLLILLADLGDQKVMVAVDDFTFRRTDTCGMLPIITTTPSQPDTTSGGSCFFQCIDGSGCIEEYKVCDFYKDCADASDEKTCPKEYNFADCMDQVGSADCGFQEDPKDRLDWVVASDADTENTPFPIYGTDKFLWIKQNDDSDVETSTARVHSHEYKNSNAYCTLRFFYSLQGDVGDTKIKTGIHLLGTGVDLSLDYLPDPSDDGKWEERSVQIGRRTDRFQLLFKKDESDSYFAAGVAIDNLELEGCDMARPQDTCPQELPFHCANQVCIEADRRCDLTDDCGDMNDEAVDCQKYTFVTFEDGTGPFLVQDTTPTWAVGTGEISNLIPLFDHTSFNYTGHYMYVDTHYGEQKTVELATEKFSKSVADYPCAVTFYTHILGDNIATLKVILRGNEGEGLELTQIQGAMENKWMRNRIEIVNSTYLDEYSLVFQVTVGPEFTGNVAVDDVVFSPECRVPCREDQYTCNNGDCIDQNKVCDFWRDCRGGDDEETCPDFYDFESCDTIERCKLYITQPSQLNWIVSDVKNDEYGPNVDFRNTTDGHFLFVKAEENAEGVNMAQVETSKYRNSGTNCLMEFYVYLSSASSDNVIVPLLRHDDLGYATELDHYDLTIIDNGIWYKSLIGLGRHKEAFTLILAAVHGADGAYDAGIALDDLTFFDCEVIPPQDECMQDIEYHCAVTKGCVKKDQLCDLSDDCGDSSDETLPECASYIRFDFEDTAPMGFFSPTNPDAGFQWVRGNGTTANRHTGPPFDHTKFSPEGHYLYIESDRETMEPAVMQSQYLIPGKSNCTLRFFVHLHGKGLGTLTVYSEDTEQKRTEIYNSKNYGDNIEVNAWQLVHAPIAAGGKFRLVFEATVGTKGEGDIAIDDLTITPECSLECDENQFKCGDGECVDKKKWCNFKNDCQDGSDESECPKDFSFENCKTLDECLWHSVIQEDATWTISGVTEAEYAPHQDYQGGKDGHFVLGSDSTSAHELHEIEGPTYRDSGPNCRLEFYVYLNGDSNNVVLSPLLQHINLGITSELDQLDFDAVEKGIWNKILIGLGRHNDDFKTGFKIEHLDDGAHNGNTAIDEVEFFDCALPPAKDSCYNGQEFHCKDTRACIPNEQLCDLTDDCGDSSDEADILCQLYQKTDFENLDKPLGFFEDYDPQSFTKWVRGNGSTQNKNTGPPFDHTLFNPEGHYLYVSSDQVMEEQTKATIATPFFKAAPQDKNCEMRVFVHLYGKQVGNLTIYTEFENKERRKLWESYQDPAHVVSNIWQRIQLPLNVEEMYRIVVEANIATKGKGDIAIDDVTFTPGCKWNSEETTTPHPTHTTEHWTTEKRTTRTTEKYTTQHRTTEKRTTARWTTEPVRTTEVTPPGGDPHKDTVVVIAGVAAGILVLLLVGGSIYAVRSRKIKLPTMDRISSVLNPNYNRLQDSNMVSLRELVSREQSQS